MRRSHEMFKSPFNHGAFDALWWVLFFHEFYRSAAIAGLPLPPSGVSTARYELQSLANAPGADLPDHPGFGRGLETAAFLQHNGTLQYLTGLGSYPDPQSLRRRFLLQAPPDFREQLHRLNDDRLLQQFITGPSTVSRLILDLDSTVLTVFGRQEGARWLQPRYRGKRSYDPLLCLKPTRDSGGIPNCARRPGTWVGSVEVLASCFLNVPGDIRELRVRADAGFRV